MKVELINAFGNDEMVTSVARVSYGKESSNYTEEQNNKLLLYLASHKHTSPFRHPQLQFRINCPIFVERQLFKHQVGWSANSISGRYVDFSDTYDVPTQLRLQSTSSKQGSGDNVSPELNEKLTQMMNELVSSAQDLYAELCAYGVAKEQARTILPLCLNTEFIWTGSFLGFVHLCNLRLKPDAQKETRDVVTLMLESVKSIENNPFNYSLKAFNL